MSKRRLWLTIAIFGALTACSPYAYNQEISNFSNGVTAVTTIYESGRQALAASAVQQWQRNEIDARGRLDLLSGCDAVDASGTPPKLPDCEVVAFGTVAATPPTEDEIALASAAPTFAALKAYVGALAAVTTASDDASLTRAVQSLSSSATGLISATAKAASSASVVNADVTGTTGFLGQILGGYLDSRRLAALRAAVPQVDSSVAALGATVRAALLDIRAQQIQRMQKDMHAAVLPFQLPSVGRMAKADYQKDLTALSAQVAAFKQVRAADPSSVVTAMIDAHHQLAQALANESGQSQAVFASADNFLKTATELASALEASAAGTGPAPSKTAAPSKPSR